MHRRPRSARRSTYCLAVLVALFPLLSSISAWAQISLTTLGTPYSQNFDSLASSGTSSTVPAGWAFTETGTSANTTYTAGTGSSTTGDTYSFGSTASTERAFGGLRSASLVPIIGASFSNNTGSAISSLDIAYTGEQWRLGTRNRFDSLHFQISVDATNLTNGTWMSISALHFVTPDTSGTAGARDGNAASNRTVLSANVSSLSIAAGANFWIRWIDFDAAGADDGLAIDNFSLTPLGSAECIPPGASATGGHLTCTTTSVTLNGSSTNGTTYLWNGPSSFSSTAQNPSASVSGTYTLTVTNSLNGCTSTAQAIVDQNTTPPGASATGGTITCQSPTVQLRALPDGFSYSWSRVGGGFSSVLQNPTIAVSGIYVVTVTNIENGCSSSAQAIVDQSFAPPGGTATGGTISCVTSCVQIVLAPAGMNYSWSGPGGFTSSQQNPTVCTSGSYCVIITNPTNGCSSTVCAIINENTAAPIAGATGGTITCTDASVVLQSSPSGMSYSWSRVGGGFTSTQQHPMVGTSGTYVVTVTNTANGCTGSAQAMVNEASSRPTCLITPPSPLPECGTTGNILQATTSADSFYWSVTGSGWAITSGQNTNQVTYTAGTGSGTLTLKIFDRASGCSDSCIVLFSCTAGDNICTLGQGFYGNAGGKFHGVPTLQLITNLLSTDLVIGKTGRSVRWLAGSNAGISAQCIINKLPASGPSDALPNSLGDQTIGSGCNTADPIVPEKNGRFRNAFLGQLIALCLNVRLDGQLGEIGLCNQMVSPRGTFSIPGPVLNALASLSLPQTVNGLIELAHRAIAAWPAGGANLNQIHAACGAINEMFEGCQPLISCSVGSSAPMSPMEVEEVPALFALHANYPNPFNPVTQIAYDLPLESRVMLTVFNTLGQTVAVLASGVEQPGYRTATFSASELPSGIYFYRLTATSTANGSVSFMQVKKMLLLR
jgi:hypothetical protein